MEDALTGIMAVASLLAVLGMFVFSTVMIFHTGDPLWAIAQMSSVLAGNAMTKT